VPNNNAKPSMTSIHRVHVHVKNIAFRYFKVWL